MFYYTHITWIFVIYLNLTFIYSAEDVFITFHIEPKNSNCHLKESVYFTIERFDEHHKFFLKRNDDIDTNIPVFTVLTDHHGRASVIPEVHKPDKETAVYHDVQNGASLMIHCVNEVNDTDGYYVVDGHVHINSENYRLEPASYDGGRHTDGDNKYLYSISPQLDDHHTCYSTPDRGSKDYEIPAVDRHASRITSRRKRAAVTVPVIVDVAVYVDYAAYLSWLSRNNNDEVKATTDILRYFTHVMSGVNLRFQTLKPDVIITIRPISMYIHKEATPWTDSIKETRNNTVFVNAVTALDEFTKWLNDKSITNFDLAVTFTGHNLYSTGNEEFTTGLAKVGNLCKTDGTSVAISEDKGGFESIVTTTHEFGHSFNANHDADGNTCRSDDRFIMADKTYTETVNNALHPWKFSTCSLEYFTNFLQSLIDDAKTVDCITKLKTTTDIPDISQEIAGQIYGPDEQCRHIHGTASYVCRGSEFGSQTEVCRKMFCGISADSCVSIIPAHGTSCGNKKWCIQGECVSNDLAPVREANCVYGDQDTVLQNNIDCAYIRTIFNGYCYDPYYQERCCETCTRANTQRSDCEYGDRKSGCVATNCGRHLENDPSTLYDVGCCGTCYGITTKTPTSTETMTTTVTTTICTDVSRVNSQTCPQLIQNNGDKQCYDSRSRTLCCATCASKKRNVVGCEFGDKNSACVIDNCDKPIEGQGRYSDVCCETCPVSRSTIPVTTPFTNCVDGSGVENVSCSSNNLGRTSGILTLTCGIFAMLKLLCE